MTRKDRSVALLALVQRVQNLNDFAAVRCMENAGARVLPDWQLREADAPLFKSKTLPWRNGTAWAAEELARYVVRLEFLIRQAFPDGFDAETGNALPPDPSLVDRSPA